MSDPVSTLLPSGEGIDRGNLWRAFMRSGHSMTLAEARTYDLTNYPYVFIEDLNRLFKQDLTSTAADNGLTVFVDSTGNRFLATTGWQAVREKLTADLNLYVNGSTGSDSNDGLTSGTAFATLQKAADVAFGNYDLGGYDITVNVAAGSYNDGVRIDYPQVGVGVIKFLGDTTTPSNVTVNKTGGAPFYATGNARFAVAGIKMTGTYCVRASSGAIIDLKTRNEFGGATAHRIFAELGGVVFSDGEEIISGTAAGGHYRCNQGTIYCQSATWTASGTATQGVFAWCSFGGLIFAFANSPSGTFSGQRYNASLNGVVTSNGGGASYFPGSTAGATSTGGQYA